MRPPLRRGPSRCRCCHRQHRQRNSERLQVRRRSFALLATFQVEADLLALIQSTKASALNRRDMDEDILRAVIGLNEAKSLLSVEPLDRSLRHRNSLQANRRPAHHGSKYFSHWGAPDATVSQDGI